MNPAPPVTSTFISRPGRNWEEKARSARRKFAARKSTSGFARGISRPVAYSDFTQLTLSKFGTVYRSMAEAKKGVARIPVPPRKQSKVEDSEPKETPRAEQHLVETESRGVHMLMSEAVQPKRDPLTVPLIGLLLAFSVISLILQLLIAFS